MEELGSSLHPPAPPYRFPNQTKKQTEYQPKNPQFSHLPGETTAKEIVQLSDPKQALN